MFTGVLWTSDKDITENSDDKYRTILFFSPSISVFFNCLYFLNNVSLILYLVLCKAQNGLAEMCKTNNIAFPCFSLLKFSFTFYCQLSNKT